MAVTAVYALLQNHKTQKRILLTDLLNREFEIRSQILNCNDKSRLPELREMLFNYFEYISYLIINRRVEEKPIKELLGPSLQRYFESYKKNEGKEASGEDDYVYWGNVLKKWHDI